MNSGKGEDMSARDRLIETAVSQLGYKAGAGKVTKYAADLDKLGYVYNGPKNGYDWCDVFVDWCFYKTFGRTGFKMLYQPEKGTGAGCPFSADFFRENGAFYSTPAIGDQIFFGASGDEYHTGIVSAFTDTQVTTIEGNTGGGDGAVMRKTYARYGGMISGYGRPKWSLVEKEEKQDSENLTAVALRVIAGDFGNGDERIQKLKKAGYEPDQVQTVVNEIVYKADIMEAARRVILGDYGNGDERIRNLEKDGYDPSVVQNMVNNLLRS